MSKNIVAIIPARGGSKGVPRKNVKDFCGKPLLAHTVEQALAAETVNRVVLTSEDDEIIAAGEQYGADILRRPQEMATDAAKVDPLLIWSVEELEKSGDPIDILVLLYPTAPLRGVEAIDATVRRVRDEGFDSALTLMEDKSYLWRVEEGIASPTNYSPSNRAPRQQEAWNQWIENKAVYAMTRNLLLETKCRIHGRVGYVEMDALRSIDIDNPSDFVIAETVYNKLLN